MARAPEHLTRRIAAERPHPEPVEYVKVAVVLAIVTMLEVWIYYVKAVRHLLVPMLLVLSATKFSLVVLWYMHLRFDSRLFRRLFAGGLLLAGGVYTVALLTLLR